MKPSSRVLIRAYFKFLLLSALIMHHLDEFVLQHVDRVAENSSAFNQAPEPLLPNYGVGKIRHYNTDLDMMIMLNSQERYLEEFVQLGEEAGLRFEKYWDLGEMGAVELRLA
jgi:hypothetical protein